MRNMRGKKIRGKTNVRKYEQAHQHPPPRPLSLHLLAEVSVDERHIRKRREPVCGGRMYEDTCMLV